MTPAQGGTGPAGPSRPRGLRLQQLLSVTDQTDVTGRPLLEDAAPKRARKEAERAGITMKTVRCDYADSPSRLGGLMNVSAYEAVRHDTAEILNGFAWLTARHLRDGPPTGSVRLFFDVTYFGINLPLVLFHRAHDPVPPYRALPSFVASLFKASRGMFSAAVDLLNDRGAAAQVSEHEVVTFAERRGHLARKESQRVCAAPTRLLERTIRVILTGEGADADKSTLGETVDFTTLREFSAAQDALGSALSSYGFLLHQLVQATGIRDPTSLFDQTVVVDGRSRSFGWLSEALVEHLNGVQAGLNHILGREHDVQPVTFQEALRFL